MSFLNSLFGRKAAVEPLPTPTALQPSAATPGTLSYFRVRTGRGNWLSAGEGDQAGQDFFGMRDVLDASTAAIAVVPDASRQLCFLIAPDARPMGVRSDTTRSMAISAFRVATDAPGLIRLKHPLDPMRYMAVTQPGQGGADGWVIFDSFGDSMLSVFGLLPLGAADVPAGVQGLARELALAAAPPPQASVLMAHLRAGRIRQALAETTLRLLPRDELAALASMLMQQPAELALLRQAMGGDPFVARALPALAAWREARAPLPGHVQRSPVADQVAAESFEGLRLPDLGMAVLGLARRQTGPRRSACILATARNEGPYLLDWISYHLSTGFEHIFLYTNDNADESDALLEALARHGVITLVHNASGPQIGPQSKAYAHALLLLPQILDYRWTAVVDLDEYVGFDARMFSSITEFIAFQETQPVDAIALCWLFFVAGRRQGWSAESSLARFPGREPEISAHVKSLFRTKDFWQAQAHFPRPTMEMPFVFRTETGMLHHHHGIEGRIPAFAETPSAQLAWVNHYILRSAPEAVWKLARRRADWTETTATSREIEHAHWLARTFMAFSEPGRSVEDTRINLCAAGQEAALARLLALPGVAEIDARIKASFGEKLHGAVETFLASPVHSGEPAEMVAFRDLLRSL